MSSESDTALVVLVPPTTFHPFPKLPLELRIKIWVFAANEQRTITVQEDDIWTTCGDNSVLTTRGVKHNAHSVPTVLHTSYEARSAARRHYELYVNPRFKNKGFYINFASDTFAILSCGALLSLYGGLEETQTSWQADVLELEHKLEFLGLRTWTGGFYRPSALMEILQRFWRLKEFLISALCKNHWSNRSLNQRRAEVEKELGDGWGAFGCRENQPATTWVPDREWLGPPGAGC